jgi:hypothetical protein
MQERSLKWQAVGALLISSVVLAVVLATAWFVDRADQALIGTSPPLPSGLPAGNAYLLTLLTAGLGILSGGVMIVGVRQAKYFTKQFAWLVYVAVGLPLLAFAALPLQRGGQEAFWDFPDWMVSMPGHVVVAVALGGLLLGALDLRRLLPGLVLESARPTPRAPGNAVRGLPGRFTPNAWRALSFMQEEAQRFEHAYMGTEHLLLGLLRDSRSQAMRVLVNLGVEPPDIRAQLEGVIGRRGSLFTGAAGMTRRCQRVIESAASIARSSSQRTVGTGHLLQALVDQPEDVASQLLESAGVTADRVSAELRHIGPEVG